MASFERGTKRQCLNCGTKFYDLNRDPIVCPHCGKVFLPEDKPSPRHPKDEEVEVEKVEVEEVEEKTQGPEIVSLDEAAAEEESDDDEVPDVEDVEDVEDIGEDDADVFLEDDDDDDDEKIAFNVKDDD